MSARTTPEHRTMADADGADSFPNTRWSLVGRVGHQDVQVQRAALAELLQHYMPAIRVYLVNVRRIPPDRADDLLQGFLVSKVLEEELLQRAKQEQGKFRTFLLTALDRFLVSQHRYEHRQKRDGGLETGGENQTVSTRASPEPPPDEAFDIAWARELLGEAVRRMEEECTRLDRADIWGVFEQRILAATLGHTAPLPYETLVARYGLKSPAHAANILITGKRMFARMLRLVVAEYETDETRIEQEIAELREILARPRN